MKTEHYNFIAKYTDVFPDGYCQHLINEFERLVSNGAGYDRRQSENASAHVKKDLQLVLNASNHNFLEFENKDPLVIFFDHIQQCFNEYVNTYSILKEGRIRGSIMKMQRTSPGGGYHVWHSEQNSGTPQVSRVLTYMLYLNTLNPDEAGETEFLYQQMRETPKENTVLLWPAAFTHTHRGNTVFGKNCKYIVTGWFNYD
jgi:hypothetical protein